MNKNQGPYEVIEQHRLCEGRPYTVYGIMLNARPCCWSIGDITTEEDEIVRLVELFNENSLDESQFRDAVEDYISKCSEP